MDVDFWRKEYIKSTLLLTTGGKTAQREFMTMLAPGNKRAS